MPAEPLKDYLLAKTSRRKLLRTTGAAAVGAPFVLSHSGKAGVEIVTKRRRVL